MHEMAITHSLVDLIRDEQSTRGFTAVRRVIVEIGKLGHVDSHALHFAFDAATVGTSLNEAELEIREIDGTAWCMDCSRTVALDRRGDGCPNCGQHMLILNQGEELRLKELEVV